MRRATTAEPSGASVATRAAGATLGIVMARSIRSRSGPEIRFW